MVSQERISIQERLVKEALKDDAGAVRKPADGSDPNLVNPVDTEVYKLDHETAPTNN